MREGFAAETWPTGEWEVYFEDVSIVGERHRIAECGEFIDGLRACIGGKAAYGVRLAREPSNPHDPYAIAVFGFWTKKGWLSSERAERQLGYIYGKLAYRIGQELPVEAPLGAALADMQMRDGEPNIVVHILVPPAWSPS